ncbi:hypothetical protein JAAARDRAFT_62534 [Jaapia argillacea MUCL 33604]|uniref:LamG-like jellyroll fold domain-containing protein n=1 Tax=Jaapia argillacea MUCL 33604 TaxID=933084 RepID=A0A067P8T1_9AGAM|nr:hypothetical protein JAAARDRAFT_62534 [Jaapia argillacea MUCL 33604]
MGSSRCYGTRDDFYGGGVFEDWLESMFDINSPFTIACWALSGGRGHTATLLSIESAEWDRSIINLFIPNGEYYFTAALQHGGRDPGNVLTVSSKTMKRIALDAWYHVVLVRDSERLRLYVDGNEYESVGINKAAGPCLAEQPRLCLGAAASGNRRSAQWDGHIEGVKIWNSALAKDQVERLSGSDHPCPGGYEFPRFDPQRVARRLRNQI